MSFDTDRLISAAEPVEFRTHEGIILRGDAWGSPEAKPVLLLHGGGQTRQSWGRTAAWLGRAGRRAICLDARGHGESDWSPDGRYSLWDFAEDLRRVVEVLGERPAVVGASLGGITALLAESRFGPEFLSELVLVDITPRTEPEGVERIIEFMRAKPEGFESVEEAAEAVAGYLPHRRRPKDASGLERNLRRGEDGRWRWHWDRRILEMGNLGREEGGNVDSGLLSEAARSLRIPTLLVRGQLSDIVSPEGVEEFLSLAPHAEFVDVSDAGHMVAGDSNDVFTEAVSGFLMRKRGRDDD
jgi:pimeloyl-ACP methyl ester carboxylesterase